MNKPQKGSLTRQILMLLKDKSFELLDLSATIIFEPRKLMRGMGIYANYNRYPLYNLGRSSYFTKVDDNRVSLNSNGRIEIIKQIIKEKNKAKAWDEKWRAIIFDVPERRRKKRDFLREELKWMGFKELQHSIWIVPWDIEKELMCLLKLWQEDFMGDVRFLTIEKINHDHDLKKKFVHNKQRPSVIMHR